MPLRKRSPGGSGEPTKLAQTAANTGPSVVHPDTRQRRFEGLTTQLGSGRVRPIKSLTTVD